MSEVSARFQATNLHTYQLLARLRADSAWFRRNEELAITIVHRALLQPQKVRLACPACGLQRHDFDAVHCEACGATLNIPDEGAPCDELPAFHEIAEPAGAVAVR